MELYCFSCQFMPGNRCVHQQGIQAATPFTPACALFKLKHAPPLTEPAKPAECPHCHAPPVWLRRVLSEWFCSACNGRTAITG